MERTDIVLADDFCIYHKVSYTFIQQLNDAGLVDVDMIEERHYLYTDQLKNIEPLIRLHNELDINMEGIEAIAHLLSRMTAMQKQMMLLQQRLKLYED